MKKIVGILSAVAILSTSVFAADVSAKVRLDGDLFNYNGDTKEVKVLSIGHHTSQKHNPIMAFSTNSDNVGAAFSVFVKGQDGGDNYDITSIRYNVWFKPFDMLRVDLGYQSTGLNQEHIEWSNSNASYEGYAYGFGISKDSFSANLIFSPGWSNFNDGGNTLNPWLGKQDGVDAVVKDFIFKAQYGADFGTLSGLFWAQESFKQLRFGAGYTNTFGSVNMFVQALGFYANEEFSKIRAEAYAEANIDALNLQLFVVGGYNVGKKSFEVNSWKVGGCNVAEKPFVGINAKVTYRLDAVSLSCQIKDGNFLQDDFGMMVKPGITGNFGTMAWEGYVQFNLNKPKDGDFSANISVPVIFTVNF